MEIAGRLCYRAFGTELNKNLTKVREGNEQYIGNILAQKHGSVIEHATVTFALLNVSRIFTHELVRHRAGTAFSQESGRFIRVDDIGFYLPNAFHEQEILKAFEYAPDAASLGSIHKYAWADSVTNRVKQMITDLLLNVEVNVKEVADRLGLDNPKMPFKLKKIFQSAIRRMIPGGAGNHIIVTANHRAWRHMIEMRTSPGAEEEAQITMYYVAKKLQARFPHMYQDMTINGLECTFANSKV